MWWITRSINEFTITLPPKSTFSMLMEPKEVTRWLWSCGKAFKRNRKDLSLFRSRWCSILVVRPGPQEAFLVKEVCLQHSNTDQSKQKQIFATYNSKCPFFWAYEGFDGSNFPNKSPLRALVHFGDPAHQWDTRRKNAQFRCFLLANQLRGR